MTPQKTAEVPIIYNSVIELEAKPVRIPRNLDVSWAHNARSLPNLIPLPHQKRSLYKLIVW